ncbi:MAG: hypothetical protein ACTH5K_06200, partial [Pseudolactococcus laudensis]
YIFLENKKINPTVYFDALACGSFGIAILSIMKMKTVKTTAMIATRLGWKLVSLSLPITKPEISLKINDQNRTTKNFITPSAF